MALTVDAGKEGPELMGDDIKALAGRLRSHPGPNDTVPTQFRTMVAQRHEAADALTRMQERILEARRERDAEYDRAEKAERERDEWFVKAAQWECRHDEAVAALKKIALGSVGDAPAIAYAALTKDKP